MDKLNLMLGLDPHTWLIIFIVVTMLDALLTLYALKIGGKEANPIINFLMRKVSPPIALGIIKLFSIALIYFTLQVTAVYLPILVLLYIGVCAWNILQITRISK